MALLIIQFWLFQTRRSPLLRNLTVAPAHPSRPSPRAKPVPVESLVLMAKTARPGHTLTMPLQRPKLPASSLASNQVNDANKTSTAWLPLHSSVPFSVCFHLPVFGFQFSSLYFPLVPRVVTVCSHYVLLTGTQTYWDNPVPINTLSHLHKKPH